MTRFPAPPAPITIVVEKDPRIGWALLDGPTGERWVRDRDRLGWGQDRAYSRWQPDDEAERLRGVARYQRVSAVWGDL